MRGARLHVRGAMSANEPSQSDFLLRRSDAVSQNLFKDDLTGERRRRFSTLRATVSTSPMLPTARLPENLPTPTNNIVLFVVLCLFVFGLMAFAKFMQRRERKRHDD